MERGDKCILVLPFEDAPEGYQKLSTSGGDEDWIVFIPEHLVSKVLMYGVPTWIMMMDSLREPHRHDLGDGSIVFIGCH